MSYQGEILDMCKDAHIVFIYISRSDEVETRGIIESLIDVGKRIVVPVCDTTTKGIVPSEIGSLDACEAGAYGICEPKEVQEVLKNEIDIYIVPGTQFDRDGNRKGRGLGYFDKFLKDIKGTKKIIGLCFENQLIEKIDPNPWDVAVDVVISTPRN